MIKLGWLFTIYVCLSFALFLITSFTISAWIIYLFVLLPFYAVVLLTHWLFVWQNRTRTGQIKYGIWGIVLVLQLLAILASPGNCYGVKQGAACYSNLQIVLSDVPGSGPSNSPHWKLVEDALPGVLTAYGVAVIVGLVSTSVTNTGRR